MTKTENDGGASRDVEGTRRTVSRPSLNKLVFQRMMQELTDAIDGDDKKCSRRKTLLMRRSSLLCRNPKGAEDLASEKYGELTKLLPSLCFE